MDSDSPAKPSTTDLPKYIREPLESSSPDRLEVIAAYAADLAEWKRRQRQEELERRRSEEEVDEEQLEELVEREVSTDPADYDDVPAKGAYITVKTTKRTEQKEYRYFYWQWRDGDSWKNEYIAPVNPKE